MLPVFFGLCILAIVPLGIAAVRFNRMTPGVGLRVIAALTDLGAVAAVVGVAALITGHAKPVQIVPGYLVAGLIDLGLIEVLRRRTVMH